MKFIPGKIYPFMVCLLMVFSISSIVDILFINNESFARVKRISRIEDDTVGMQPAIPHYKRASYASKSIELKNNYIKLQVFKRLGGWGWGEISDNSGKLMAVMDHLGEIMIEGQDIPMRFESENVKKESSAEGISLIFDIKSVVVKDKLKGTSFEGWMNYPYTEPCIVGQVILTIAPDKPIIYCHYKLKATGNYAAKYIRGPWLKVGEGSFGVKKDDSIFPGLEWTTNDEWSSGNDWFKDPWALRAIPHPYKVAIPLMALSYQGTGIGLAWDPNQTVTRWFNYSGQRPQPVFATPNFIDRMNNSLMGIMIPDASEGDENQVNASRPLDLRIGQVINFDAEIWLSKGNSLDVVTDWVKRHGLPKPPEPRWSFKETLDKIANAYNTNFWHEGEGFGTKQRPEDKIHPSIPAFVERYIKDNKGATVAKGLKKKIEWCRSQIGDAAKVDANEEKKNLEKKGDYLIKIQRNDGSFYFDPKGRHYAKDDFRVATSFIEPMGLELDTALDVCILPVTELLNIADKTGEQKYKDAAQKALQYSLIFTRPEGGDFWETPLHAPNLLAAGHAAIAYYEGYKAFGNPQYKERAIYWIRSILPFTNLWEPDNIQELYNTKPCFCSSDWYFANWVRDHVQWEVLSVFAASSSMGIQWAKIDPDIDWKRFQEGITVAAIRWMRVHTDDNWRPHNIPTTYDAFKRGDYDYCFPDTHNSMTGNYGGMFIMPEVITQNIYSLLDYDK